jgi:hypothetical protein
VTEAVGGPSQPGRPPPGNAAGPGALRRPVQGPLDTMDHFSIDVEVKL